MADSQIDQALVDQCLADGADGVRQMIAEVLALAEQFRSADVTAANSGLARLARDLKSLVLLVHGLRDAASTREHAFTLFSNDEVSTLVAWLESIVAAQESQKWLTVANLLECELAPELRMWLERFAAASSHADVRTATPSAAPPRNGQV